MADLVTRCKQPVEVQSGPDAPQCALMEHRVLVPWPCTVLGSLASPSFTIALTKTIMPASCIVYLSKQEGDSKVDLLVKQDFKHFI